MEINFLFAVASMLFVASLPLVAKFVDWIFNRIERNNREGVHERIVHN